MTCCAPLPLIIVSAGLNCSIYFFFFLHKRDVYVSIKILNTCFILVVKVCVKFYPIGSCAELRFAWLKEFEIVSKVSETYDNGTMFSDTELIKWK